jgi:uncharacterized protein YaiI (UPF0178 family)
MTGVEERSVSEIYVDGDACPVREEVYRVADRLNLRVYVVANGSRPIRPTGRVNVNMVLVDEGPDAADDWIVTRIARSDICVTADIPLAARVLAKGARAIAPTGKPWTSDNIGNALAGREIARHMRELGLPGGGPAPFKKADRSRFLSALDAAVQAALNQQDRSREPNAGRFA